MLFYSLPSFARIILFCITLLLKYTIADQKEAKICNCKKKESESFVACVAGRARHSARPATHATKLSDLLKLCLRVYRQQLEALPGF